ncbi:unnamed protein product, partial [Choristocarpus tenellus]
MFAKNAGITRPLSMGIDACNGDHGICSTHRSGVSDGGGVGPRAQSDGGGILKVESPLRLAPIEAWAVPGEQGERRRGTLALGGGV